MLKKLNEMLGELRTIQARIDDLEEKKTTKREELLQYLQDNDIKSHKNPFASITSTERKTIKIENRDNVISWLINNNLTNFLDYTPEHLEPAKYELNKDFDDRVKKGFLQPVGVTVETKFVPLIKFI